MLRAHWVAFRSEAAGPRKLPHTSVCDAVAVTSTRAIAASPILHGRLRETLRSSISRSIECVAPALHAGLKGKVVVGQLLPGDRQLLR